MKLILFNIGYFFKEIKNTIKLNLLSNMFSFLGTFLILFILAMVVAGWNVSNSLIQMLKDEAEISAYFEEDISVSDQNNLVDQVRKIYGVTDVRVVDESEAYERMKNVLGNEAEILSLFEDNPFEAYMEIRVNLNEADRLTEKFQSIRGIRYVRDNRDVLEQIEGIVNTLNSIGFLVIAAVGVTTLVIISHMIRQGIYNNRLQIHTLQLLGASDSFIGFPFFLVGLFITLGGGMLASIFIVLVINSGFSHMTGAIRFIPLPPKAELVQNVVTVIMSVSAGLGVLGSLFGLTSIKEDAKSI